MDKINRFVLFCACLSFVSGDITIVDLKVPSTIESGVNDEVILDCDYIVKDETGLEVKWFYDNGDEMIYQWLPPNRKPQALGFLKDRIDLEYKVSDDPNTMHRALRIKDVTTDLSGNYTCKVTSFYSEAVATKKMTIYEPAKDFDLIHMEDQDMFLCSAYGVFPAPKMNAYILGIHKNATAECMETDGDADDDGIDDNADDENDDDDDDDDDQVDKKKAACKQANDADDDEEPGSNEDDDDWVLAEDNTYNITASHTYNEEDLPLITTFVCELWIPGTTYKKIIKQDFYPGGPPTPIETQIESDNDSEYEFSTNATDAESSGTITLPKALTLFIVILSSALQRLL